MTANARVKLMLMLVSLACAPAMAADPAPTTKTAASLITPRAEIESRPIRRTGDVTAKSNGSQAKPADAPNNGFDIPRVGLSLSIVIGLIIIARIAMRKLFPAATVGRTSQAIKVISRSVLAPKQQFLLLHVGKRLIVVGDTGTSMNALAEITDPNEVAELIGTLSSESATSSVASSAAAFGALFKRTTSHFEKESDERVLAAEKVHGVSVEQESAVPDNTDDDEQLVRTSGEIKGLMERVRMLSQQVGR